MFLQKGEDAIEQGSKSRRPEMGVSRDALKKMWSL
jgi:hypothetical protein